MLHLQTEILQNSNYCVVEYENPNLDITKNYTLRFHSVYSKPNEFGTKTVPLTFTIQDSPYASYFEYKDFHDKKIKKISSAIVKQINHQNSAYKRYLKRFIVKEPSANYNNNAKDYDVNTRFFNINLPKNTYLFSNYKPILYALGYSEDQLEYVQDIRSIGIPNNVIVGSQSQESTNIQSVWIVRNNQNSTSVYPIKSKNGNLKWKKNDKFEDVFFTSKKQERYVNVENEIFRFKRQAGSNKPLVNPKILGQELQIMFNENDDFNEQRFKVNKTNNWNRRAELIQIIAVQNFNWQELKPSPDVSSSQAKLNYWRTALVREITRTSKLNEDVIISIPDSYFTIDGKTEIAEPMQFLLNDSKTYVRIAAAKTLYLFFNKYRRIFEGLKNVSVSPQDIADYEEEIATAQEGSKLILQEFDKFTKEGTDLVKKSLKNIEKLEKKHNEQRGGNNPNPPNSEGGNSNDPTANQTSGSSNSSSVLPPSNIDDQKTGEAETGEEPTNQEGRKRGREDENATNGGEDDGEVNNEGTEIVNGGTEPPPKKQVTQKVEMNSYSDKAQTIASNIEAASERVLAAIQESKASAWEASALGPTINENFNSLLFFTTQAKDAYDLFPTLLKENTQRSLLLAQNEVDDMQTSATEAKNKLDEIVKDKMKIVAKTTIINRSNTILKTVIDDSKKEQQDLLDILEKAKMHKNDFPLIYNNILNYKNRVEAAITKIIGTKATMTANLYTISSANSNVLQKESEGLAKVTDAENFAETSQNLLDSKIRHDDDYDDMDDVVDNQSNGSGSDGGDSGGNSGGSDGGSGGGSSGGNGINENDDAQPTDGNGGGDNNDNNINNQGQEEDEEEPEEDSPEINMDDERNWPNFQNFNSCSVGIVHFANKLITNDETAVIEVDEDTTAASIVRQLNTILPKIIQKQYNLNFNIKADINKNVSNSGQENETQEKSYLITNLSPNTDSTAYIEFDLHSIRNAYLLRLTKSGLPTCKIKININEQFPIKSDNFKVINPYKDSFKKNLPLIAMPVNAGLTNSFFTGIGLSSSFGIIETNGKVKDAVSIYMRPAKKERFFLYFLTTQNQDIYFDTPSLLYLHFIVEPLHV